MVVTPEVVGTDLLLWNTSRFISSICARENVDSVYGTIVSNLLMLSLGTAVDCSLWSEFTTVAYVAWCWWWFLLGLVAWYRRFCDGSFLRFTLALLCCFLLLALDVSYDFRMRGWSPSVGSKHLGIHNGETCWRNTGMVERNGPRRDLLLL